MQYELIPSYGKIKVWKDVVVLFTANKNSFVIKRWSLNAT